MAAIVLCVVSLAGGRGGVVGPILAVVILALIRTDLTFLGVNPNLSTAVQGVILIGVVNVRTLPRDAEGPGMTGQTSDANRPCPGLRRRLPAIRG